MFKFLKAKVKALRTFNVTVCNVESGVATTVRIVASDSMVAVGRAAKKGRAVISVEEIK